MLISDWSSDVCSSDLQPQRYEIDPDHMSVAFRIMHVGFHRMTGLFTEGGGSFAFDEATQKLSDLKVTVKTASVFTGHKKRDDHLRSADFLNSKEFPEMTFVGKSTEKTGPRTGKIHGELTLLGVTRPVTLDVVLNRIGEYPIGGGLFGGKPYVVGINAKTQIRRSDFGMTYGVDNGLVGDEVEILIGLEARRKE